MAKRGRRPKLTIARAKQALEQAGGIRTIAAEKLAVHRSTLHTFLVRHPALQAFADEVEEVLKDVAETRIIQAIRAGEMSTVRWYAEMKMKDRGYVRRVEQTGAGGGPVEHTQKMDLSVLTDEELEILLRAAERREAKANLKAA
ncbi:hypothetical protein LHFGNBLO_004416 [Mesorhizobium sp. AR10]|uniref:hypothetical protein n=1 Tax=Mesorhizobium sp. AR10 TaxID=2865839 RepID=UPI002160F97C|nr:hypothetical protein [Mesorhizobium sp. AR10]UVK37390.1 hypothetical protein LHFGNBLO_004416 [Mesorhizobium sp. AR10]